MKKIFAILISAITLILCVSKVNASTYTTLTYSEWSMLYPSGIDERFIESEDRYFWYKVIDGKVDYSRIYSPENVGLEEEGYIKDEASKKTFYRYITSDLIYSSSNELVIDSEICEHEFCYKLTYEEPVLIDTTQKFTEEESTFIEIPSVVTPFTGDNIYYYVGIMIVSLIIVASILIYRKKKILLN